ncbi:MAG: tandem-95 repeat protein [Pseudomonadales bacterium]
MLQGGFSYKSGDIGKFAGNSRDHTKISTPSAVIRVRGSELEGTVDPVTLQTVVIHKSGFLTVTDINDNNPVILDTPNNSTMVISGGAPTNAGTATPEQMAAVQQSLPPQSVVDQADEENANDDASDDESTDESNEEGAQEGASEEASGEGEEAGETEGGAEGEGEASETGEEASDESGEDEAGEDSEEGSDDETGEESGDEAGEESGEESSENSDETVEANEGSESAEGSDSAEGSESAEGSGSAEGSESAEGSGSAEGSESTEGSSSAEGSTQADGSNSNDAANAEGSSEGSSSSSNRSSGTTVDLAQTGESGAANTGTSGQTSGGNSAAAGGGTTTGSSNPANDSASSTEDQPTQELPPDNPPTSQDDNVTLAENETRDLSDLVLANDEDPDPNQTPVLASINVTGSSGTVTLDTATQTLNYSANGDEFEALGVGETLTDTFTYTVSSGQFSSTSTVTVTVEGQNDPTIAVDDNYAVDGGVDLVVDAANGLLANDTDVDSNDTFTVIDAEVTSNDGTEVVVNSDGSFEFLTSGSSVLNQLAAGETFTSTIVYTVQSSAGDTTTATANIVVTGVNTPPETTDDSASVLENTTVTVSPLANDTDVDGDTLTLTAATVSGGNGTVTISGNELVFTPTTNLAEDGTLEETIIYTVSDGEATATGNVVVTITGVNDPPEIQTQTPEQIPEVQATSGPTDITSSVLAVIGDDSPGTEVTALDDTNTVGSVVLGSVIYDATGFFDFLNVGETFTDSFGFTATDIQGLTTDGTFSITIQGEADAPVVSGSLTFSNSEDDAALVLDLLTNASDVDATDVLSVTDVSITGNGAGINVVGSNLNLDPNAYNSLSDGETEVITLTYSVTDTTGLIAPQTATIAIAGVNDAPDVVPVTQSLLETDALTSVNLLGGASDPEGDPLSIANVALVSGLDSGVTVSGSTLLVDPSAYVSLAAGESEVVTYSFNVLDGNGGITPGSATVTINGVNNTPTSNSLSVTAIEDTPLVLDATAFPFSDVDATDLLEGVRIDTLPVLGLLRLNGVNVAAGQVISIYDLTANNLTFTPGANDNGLGYTSFNFSVGDGLTFSASNTVTIDVAPVNDAPNVVPVTLTVTEDDNLTTGDFLAGANDVEGDTLSIANLIVSSGLASGITTSGTNFTVDPGFYDGLGGGQSEVVVYSFDVLDGNGGSTPNSATITITGVNDAPTTINVTLAAQEDTPLVFTAGNFPFVDPDSLDLLEGIRIDVLPAQGVLQVNGVNVSVGQVVTINDIDNGLFSYTPALNQNNLISTNPTFSFSVGDGDAFSTSAIATIDIAPVNDDPVANPDSYDVAFNISFSATLGTDDLLLNDTDAENDTITINLTPVVDVSNGSLSINSDGTFIYTPNTNFTGTDSFVYEITDGNGGVGQGTATLNIVGSPGVFAQTTGDFSDPSIYSGLAVPDAGDDLILDSGVVVTLDATTTGPVTINSLDIDGSGGQFDLDSNTLIVTDEIFTVAISGLSVTNGNLSVGNTFINNGQLDLKSNSTLSVGTFSNELTLNAELGTIAINATSGGNNGTINVNGVAGATTTDLVLSDGFLNQGSIILQNQIASARDISLSTAGTLQNDNIISIMTGGGGGTKFINAATFANGGGTVTVGAGEVLKITAATTTFGGDTQFNGDATGTVQFLGAQTFDLQADWTVSAATIPFLDLAGDITISGVGELQILSGGELVLTEDDITADINNQGGLVVEKNTSTISSTNFSNTGTITIRGTNLATSTTLAFATAVSNAGTIVFDNAFTSPRNLTLDASGLSFTNAAGGVIQTADTSTGEGNKKIIAATFDTELGTLDIGAGDILEISAGATKFGTSTSLTGDGTIKLTGTQTLNLVTDYTVASTHGPIELAGFVTVTGPGQLIIESEASFELNGNDAIDADIANDGFLLAFGITNAINSTSITNTGVLSLQGTNATTTTTLNLANGFANDGIIELDNTFTSPRTVILDVAAGTLLNNAAANITSENSGGGGGENRILGLLTNSGTIDVNANLKIAGTTFTNTDGTINVAPGQNLVIDTMTTQLGSGAVIAGSSGTITLSGSQSVNVGDGFTVTPATPEIDPIGTVSFEGVGQLDVAAGGSLRLTNDTIAADFNNQGTTVFELAGNNVTASSFINGGNLVIKGVSAATTTSVSFTNLITNSAGGVFEFDNTFTSGRTLTAMVDMTNDGTILSNNSGGAGSANNFTLTGTITNNGAVNANEDLTINGTSFDSSGGGSSINVGAGANLGIDSTSVTLGSGGSVTGGAGSRLEFGGPTVTLSTGFDVSSTSPEIDFTGFATIDGTGPLNITGTGTLLLTTDTVTAPISVAGILNVEENNTQIDGGITTVAGGLIEIRGTSAASAVSLTTSTAFSNVAGATIELDNLFSSSRTVELTMSAVTLTNDGTIVTNNTNGPATTNTFNVNGDVVNNGTIDVNESVNFGGGTLDNSTGSVAIATGETLNYSGSNLTLGSAASLTGDGTFEVSGPLITLTAAFNYSATQPIFDLSGFLTIQGAGSLDIQSGATFTLTNDTVTTPLSNAGNLFIEELTTTLNGTLTANTGTIAVRGTPANSSTTLTVANGFTNAGTILLDNLFSSTRTLDLNVSAGTLTNDVAGTIATANSGGGGGTYTIDAEIVNEGLVDIDFDATITATSFITELGTVDVDTGAVLELNVANTDITDMTFLIGDGSIKFLGTQTINLNTDFTIGSATVDLDLAGDITIDQTANILTIDPGATLVLTGDTVSTNLVNDGELIVKENTTTINGASFTNDGTLRVEGALSTSVTNLDVTPNFFNDGTITLDNPTINNRTVNVSFLGTFTNNIQLTAQKTGSGITTLNFDVTGAFSNAGTISVNHDLLLSSASNGTNESGADINIAVDQTLDLDIANFTNNGTITLLGGSSGTTLDLSDVTTFTNTAGVVTGSGTVINSGVISGGTQSVSPGASPGLLVFDGGLNTEIILETELEGLAPSSGYDQVVVNGTANLGSSAMNVVLLNGYLPEVGDAYIALTADTITGHFGQVSGLDIASDRVLDIQYSGGDVILNAVATTSVGDSAANTLTGSAAQDVVVAGDGDDNIATGSGADIVFAQAGNDTIAVDADFSRVDGGTGIDRLLLDEVAVDDGRRIDNVEVLDIQTGTASLTATTITEVSSGLNEVTGLEDSLVVEGDSTAVLTLVGSFQYDRAEQLDTGAGLQTFDVYIDDGAAVFVSQSVLVAQQTPMASTTAEAPLDLSGVEVLAAQSEVAPVTTETASESPVNFNDVFGTEDPLSTLLANLPDASVYASGDVISVASSSEDLADASVHNPTLTSLHDTLIPLDSPLDV